MKTLQKGQEDVKAIEKQTEGKWFSVAPASIDQNLFKEERKDTDQEKARKLIIEAFEEAKKDSDKYFRKFKTMIPEMTWVSKERDELEEIANEKGDHMANWIEQVLVWAQRIANGESWEEVCNNPDPSKWFRGVKWKNGRMMHIGNASKLNLTYSATNIMSWYYDVEGEIFFIVPLIVDYD